MSQSTDLSFLYKARGAILRVVQSLDASRKTVLVPAFHCPTVVQPVLMAGFDVGFFNIHRDLSIDEHDLMSQLNESVAAIIIINYFGFESDLADLKDRCDECGIVLIEDCSHSMMNRNPLALSGSRGHAAVYSFWKNLPSVGGAGIRINDARVQLLATSPMPLATKKRIKLAKGVFEDAVNNFSDRNPIKHLLLGLESLRVRLKNRNAPAASHDNGGAASGGEVNNYAMDPDFFNCGIPGLARRIIERADLQRIEERVINNYHRMSEGIDGIAGIAPALPELPERIFPWCFPAIIENRANFEQAIRAAGANFFTFGEELHEAIGDRAAISSVARDNARYLSESIICLSINQDIDENDIAHTHHVLKEVLSPS